MKLKQTILSLLLLFAIPLAVKAQTDLGGIKAKASEDLSNLTTNLHNLINNFKLDNNSHHSGKQFINRTNGKFIGS